MRKQTLTLALAAVLSLAAAPAHAFFEANIAGGYTSLAMGDLNDALSKGTVSSSKVQNGFYVSADAGVSLLPFIKLVPRVVYIQAGQGLQDNGAFGKSTVESNLVPLELGLATDISVPLSGLSARAGVWGGYGMATSAVSTKSGTGVVTGNLYQGSAFTAEALAALRYSIVPFFSLSLEAGYRMANVTSLSDTGGKAWKNGAKDMALDFSGMNLGGGLTFSF